MTQSDSVRTALRAAFRAGAARNVRVCFEVHASGVVVHALVDGDRVTVHRGPTSDADVVIDAGPVLTALLTGEVSAADALAGGQVRVIGAPELLSMFVTLFHLPELPSSVAA
ncbi:hypothetical protein [Actinophytocola sp.]|uniref:hypothetical protein n=1 Tax=Actinophytocola sp. TaxID=1872138 RepID=UPI002ED43877